MPPLIKKRVLARALFPRFSDTVHALNWNARYFKWLKENMPVETFKWRFDMYSYLNNEVLENEPITYLEFGVWKGASIMKWAELNTNSRSRFYGFDSFEGLPDRWYKNYYKGHFDVGGATPQVEDERITFVKGWFQETLIPYLDKVGGSNRLVIHNDSDLYTSTLFCLTALDRIITSGTIIIFDEFCVAEHEFRAFIDYTTSYQKNYKSLAGSGGTFIEKVALVIV